MVSERMEAPAGSSLKYPKEKKGLTFAAQMHVLFGLHHGHLSLLILLSICTAQFVVFLTFDPPTNSLGTEALDRVCVIQHSGGQILCVLFWGVSSQ